MKEHIGKAVQSGLAGGILSCVLSGLLNYFILPFPSSGFHNAIGHSIGGFFSGFFSGLIGVLIFASQVIRRQKLNNEDHENIVYRDTCDVNRKKLKG